MVHVVPTSTSLAVVLVVAPVDGLDTAAVLVVAAEVVDASSCCCGAVVVVACPGDVVRVLTVDSETAADSFSDVAAAVRHWIMTNDVLL